MFSDINDILIAYSPYKLYVYTYLDMFVNYVIKNQNIKNFSLTIF